MKIIPVANRLFRALGNGAGYAGMLLCLPFYSLKLTSVWQRTLASIAGPSVLTFSFINETIKESYQPSKEDLDSIKKATKALKKFNQLDSSSQISSQSSISKILNDNLSKSISNFQIHTSYKDKAIKIGTTLTDLTINMVGGASLIYIVFFVVPVIQFEIDNPNVNSAAITLATLTSCGAGILSIINSKKFWEALEKEKEILLAAIDKFFEQYDLLKNKVDVPKNFTDLCELWKSAKQHDLENAKYVFQEAMNAVVCATPN